MIKDKNYFLVIVLVLFLLFFISIFWINNSYALLVDEHLSVFRNESIIVINKNEPGIKNFGVIVQQGEVFPKIINVGLGDKIRLDLMALDSDYHFYLDSNNKQFLEAGQLKNLYFQTKILGNIDFSIYRQNEYLDGGQIIIYN